MQTMLTNSARPYAGVGGEEGVGIMVGGRGNWETLGAPQLYWVTTNQGAFGGRPADGVDLTEYDANWTTALAGTSYTLADVKGYFPPVAEREHLTHSTLVPDGHYYVRVKDQNLIKIAYAADFATLAAEEGNLEALAVIYNVGSHLPDGENGTGGSKKGLTIRTDRSYGILNFTNIN